MISLWKSKLIHGSALAFGALLTLTATPAALAAQGDTTPTEIAVFDFELDDESAASGLVAATAADADYLTAVSAEVRRLLVNSGRYRLVDVSSAAAGPVRDHTLRDCNGCDAAIAAALGAEQSLIGVVKRLSRTEFVIGFQLKDARSGAVLASRDSGLRMGANYAWSRGASRLIQDRLLEAEAKQLKNNN